MGFKYSEEEKCKMLGLRGKGLLNRVLTSNLLLHSVIVSQNLNSGRKGEGKDLDVWDLSLD